MKLLSASVLAFLLLDCCSVYAAKGGDGKGFPSMAGVTFGIKNPTTFEAAYNHSMTCREYPACINGYRAYYKEWDGVWNRYDWNSDYPPLPYEETNEADAREIFIGATNEHIRCHSMCKALRETTTFVDINASNLYPILKDDRYADGLCYCVRSATRVVKIVRTDKMRFGRTGARGYASEVSKYKTTWKKIAGKWTKVPKNVVKYELQGGVYSCGVTRVTGTPDIEGSIERGMPQAGNYHDLEGSKTEPMKTKIDEWKIIYGIPIEE